MRHTTIRIQLRTRKRLMQLKTTKHETYDELINQFLEIIPSKDAEGVYSDKVKKSILRGLADVQNKRVHSLKEIRNQLGS